MKHKSAFFVEILIFYMLLAHIVDYNVCKNILFPVLIRQKLHFNTTPFRDFDKTQIYPYHSWP